MNILSKALVDSMWKEAHYNWLQNPKPTSHQQEFANLILQKIYSAISNYDDIDEALSFIEMEFSE